MRLDREAGYCEMDVGIGCRVIGGVSSLVVNQLSLVHLFDERCTLKLQPLRQLLS